VSDTQTVTALVQYDVDEATLAATREKCATLSADTPKGYEEVRVAIGALRTTRVGIEKKRVELKADALAFGRLVDSEAKRLTALVSAIEDPLIEKKKAIDDEKDRVRREAEAAKLAAIQAEVEANRQIEEMKLREAREAEEARLAEERAKLAAERAALDAERKAAEEKAAAAQAILDAARREAEKAAAAERAKLDAERRAEEERQRAARKVEEDRLRAEREKLDAERRAVEAERQKAERAEFERQARIKAEKDAADAAERAKVEKAKREAELAALLPDLERVKAFAATLRAIEAPKVRSSRMRELLNTATAALGNIATALETAVSDVKKKAA
jgi:colicin import membrane protein